MAAAMNATERAGQCLRLNNLWKTELQTLKSLSENLQRRRMPLDKMISED